MISCWPKELYYSLIGFIVVPLQVWATKLVRICLCLLMTAIADIYEKQTQTDNCDKHSYLLNNRIETVLWKKTVILSIVNITCSSSACILAMEIVYIYFFLFQIYFWFIIVSLGLFNHIILLCSYIFSSEFLNTFFFNFLWTTFFHFSLFVWFCITCVLLIMKANKLFISVYNNYFTLSIIYVLL